MKPLPKEARTSNVSGHESCRWCADSGYVEVGYRKVQSAWTVSRTRPNEDGTMPHEATFDQSGPCPFCEAGFREEFPVPKADNKRPTTPPWGAEGFWRGRDPMETELQPVYPKGFVPLPIEENARRMRELAEAAKGIGREMPE